MPQIRVEKVDRFSIISNDALQDQTLSFKARGLLGYMLSLPDDWDYSISGLAKKSKVDGIRAIRSGIEELMKAGYVHRYQSRDEKGNFDGYKYVVREKPEEPQEESPSCCFASTDFASTQNSMQQITNRTKKENIPPIVPREILRLCEGYAGADGDLLEAILGLLENRAAMKKPVKTARAMNGILNKLDKLSGGDRGMKLALLDKATVSNWLTVFPLKPDELPAKSGAYNEEGEDGI